MVSVCGVQVVQVHKSTSELGTLPYTGQPAGPQWCLAVWRGSTVFLSTEDYPYEYIFHHSINYVTENMIVKYIK